MSTFADRTLTNVFNDARSAMFLNDGSANEYTDDVLLPIAAFVIGEIQDAFAQRDVPKHEAVTGALSYVAGDDEIDYSTAIGVEDLRVPVEIWQRATASDRWTCVPKRTALPAPPVNAPDLLQGWEWSQDLIKVNPASQNLQLLVRFRIQVPYPTDATDPIGFEDYYWSLVSGVAFHAASGTERESLARRAGAIYAERRFAAVQLATKALQGEGGSWSGYNDD